MCTSHTQTKQTAPLLLLCVHAYFEVLHCSLKPALYLCPCVSVCALSAWRARTLMCFSLRTGKNTLEFLVFGCPSCLGCLMQVKKDVTFLTLIPALPA